MEQLQAMNPPLAGPISSRMRDRLSPTPAGPFFQSLADQAEGHLRQAPEPVGEPNDAAALAVVPEAKVDIRDVDFFYGKFQALHNVSVPLYDRRVTAFIGPSGC